jgi:hypothetical protein
MTGLADYKPMRRNVPIAGGSPLSVRGLNMTDFATLLHDHFPDMDKMFKLYGEAGLSAIGPMAAKMMVETPALAAAIIAYACDAPDLIGIAATLPAPTQIKAIQEIGELTFVDVGGPKNFLAMLRNLAQSVAPKAAASPNLKAV